MSALRSIVVAPVRLYQRAISPALPQRCKYHPSCSNYAVTAVRQVRHTAGAGPRGLAPPTLQPLEPRRGRLRRGPEALPPARLAHAPSDHPPVRPRRPQRRPVVLGRRRLRRRREQLGLRDHPADVHDPAADPAAHLPVGEVDAEAPGAPAGDEEDPGAVQGRPPADEPGDDEVLPGEQGQSPGLLPPAAASDPVLHRALRAAAQRAVQGARSRATRASSSSRTSPRTSPASR